MIISITGPSCCGKTTFLFQLLRRWPDKICPLIFSTTRPPRSNEQDGVHYYFVEEDAFSSDTMVEQVGFGDNLYGLTSQELQKAADNSKIQIAVVNIEGAKWLKEHYGATNVFLRVPPSVSRFRLIRRDGKEVGFTRHRIDIEQGLYDFDKADIRINCGHKKWDTIIRQFTADMEPFLERNGLLPLGGF